MPIIFDEVVGSVEERDTAPDRQYQGEEASRQPEEPVQKIARSLRRIERRRARLMAD